MSNFLAQSEEVRRKSLRLMGTMAHSRFQGTVNKKELSGDQLRPTSTSTARCISRHFQCIEVAQEMTAATLVHISTLFIALAMPITRNIKAPLPMNIGCGLCAA